jgi:hypothetical protein
MADAISAASLEWFFGFGRILLRRIGDQKVDDSRRREGRCEQQQDRQNSCRPERHSQSPRFWD